MGLRGFRRGPRPYPVVPRLGGGTMAEASTTTRYSLRRQEGNEVMTGRPHVPAREGEGGSSAGVAWAKRGAEPA
jgi:hypothetical protein